MPANPLENFDEWASALQRASPRSSAEQEAEFLQLVDAAQGHVTPNVASALMRTFSASPDYGTQERVCSVLASGLPTVVVSALLIEMPRLSREATEWAESLVCTELEHRTALLKQLVRASDPAIKAALHHILANPEFQQLQPKACLLLAACQNGA